jgi:uncharacterized membrane protein
MLGARLLGGTVDRIRNAVDAVRSRLWLIPALTSVAAAIAARLVTHAEELPFFGDIDAWWYFGGDADTARDLLSTLLSGMITMTSLVVSITIVVLSLAANQLGPRLIWNFIRDRQIQAVIGLFFGTIVFILVVVRSVHADSVPAVAVTAATALVAVCLFALLFHVSKVARSIVADTVVREVADDLLAAIASARRNLHEGPADPDGLEALPVAAVVALGRPGYVQVVDYDRLARMASRHDLVLDVRVRAGDFLLAAGEHIVVHGSCATVSDDTAGAVRKAVLVGSNRTATQDLEYAVRQLVEIALRALSPGINDPFTAITVVHRLAGALEDLSASAICGTILRDDDNGFVRVRGRGTDFTDVLDAAFNQIRQAAATTGDVSVLIAMATEVGQLAATTEDETQLAALRRHLAMLTRAADRAIPEPDDLADFMRVRIEAARRLDRARVS